MSRKRVYQPSETHLVLHPPRTLIDCPCGVRFAARVSVSPDIDSEDDPKLCLTCNRQSWSRLWNGNQPINSKFDSAWVDEYDKASAEQPFEFVSDTDIGEVVSISRRKGETNRVR